MFSVKKLFANFQPTKALLKWHRKRTAKVAPGDVLAGTQEDHMPRQPSPSRSALSSSSSQPVDKWQSQAAAQQGQSHVSSPVLEDQVRAAGPEGQAAAPHSPCCTPSPSSSQMEAPSGQQARAAVAEILPGTREGTCSEEGSLCDISSPRELSQGEENTEQSWTTGEESSSVSLPLELWAESSQSSTSVGCASAPCITSCLESLLGQCAGAAVGSWLPVAKEGTWSKGNSVWDSSSLLKLFHGREKTHQPQPPVEDIKGQELFCGKEEKDNIHTVRVEPSHPPVLLDPHTACQEGSSSPSSLGRKAAEEADADPHSTCPAPREPTDTQPAAAGLAAAPQEEGHGTALAAKAQDVAKTAASPALAEQGRPAGPEGQAAAPHSPRGSGRAVLDTLQRWARATLRRIAPVIRRRGHQHEQQTGTEQGVAAVTAPTATEEAGPQG